jgi:hypothetical protein
MSSRRRGVRRGNVPTMAGLKCGLLETQNRPALRLRDQPS